MLHRAFLLIWFWISFWIKKGGSNEYPKGKQRIYRKKIASWFHDGDVINLGVGIPILVSNYITDNVVIQSEDGILGVGEIYAGLEPEAPILMLPAIPFTWFPAPVFLISVPLSA